VIGYGLVVPARRPDPQRLLAAVTAQRAVLGLPAWNGGLSAAELGAGCVAAVLAAIDADRAAGGLQAAGAAPAGGGLLLPDAARAAVRYLLAALAQRAPGRAVEVRVPPYAAIQCVTGPRHTRGTPPNVVEADPVTWILLATGRLSWAKAIAAGRLQVSGPRSDISGYLPLGSGRPAS
jgi:hypothetical protein